MIRVFVPEMPVVLLALCLEQLEPANRFSFSPPETYPNEAGVDLPKRRLLDLRLVQGSICWSRVAVSGCLAGPVKISSQGR